MPSPLERVATTIFKFTRDSITSVGAQITKGFVNSHAKADALSLD